MQKTFSDIFEEYLNYHLAEFCGKNLNNVTLEQISNLIFEKTREIFFRCEFSFSENALRFLTKIYSNDLEINGEKFSGYQFTNDIEKINIGELDMLEQMFFDREDVLEEIRKNKL
jgi:hypothetical protein